MNRKSGMGRFLLQGNFFFVKVQQQFFSVTQLRQKRMDMLWTVVWSGQIKTGLVGTETLEYNLARTKSTESKSKRTNRDEK